MTVAEARLKLEAEQARLYERLEHAQDQGDTRQVQALTRQIVACESALDKINEGVVSEPAVAETQTSAPVAVESVAALAKETNMTENVELTLDQIGATEVELTAEKIGSTKFALPFAGHKVTVDEAAGKIAVDDFLVAFPVKNAAGKETDILILRSPVSVLDAEHRIHVAERPDARTAARGLALVMADAVQPDGSVINGVGQFYIVQGGACVQHDPKVFTNFDGSKTQVVATSPCKGRMAPNPEDAPRLCKHAWAVELSNGSFVTLSRHMFFKTVAAEISKLIGDETAQAYAQSIFATWHEAKETKQMARVAFATAISDARNRGDVGPNGLMPPASQVLDEMIDGKKVRDLVLATGGRWFIVSYVLPIVKPNGETAEINQRTRRIKDLQDLQIAIAPAYRIAKAAGRSLRFTGLTVA